WAAGSFSSPASADPIEYTGTLVLGTPLTGGVPGGDNTNNPAAWAYYLFEGHAGENITVTVRRTVGPLDDAAGIFECLDGDTFANIMCTDTGQLGTSSIFGGLASGDDQLPPAIPGPFGDAQFSLTLPDDGFYTVAVTSFLSGSLEEVDLL